MASGIVAPTTPEPDRTHRLIGVVLVASGRALDLALLEADGRGHVRRIETGRTPLLQAPDVDQPLIDRMARVLEAFMGDRTLQPFAIDLIGLAGRGARTLARPLALRLDVAVVSVSGAMADGVQRPRRGVPPFAAAERVALAALTRRLASA